MKKGIIKASVLIVVFFAALIGFSFATNKTNEDLTKEMKDATLPVVSLYTNNTQINELHGYTKSMDVAYMRDTLTPIGSDMNLPVKIQTYGMQVSSISYKIRSMDGKDLIADSDISDKTVTSDDISMNIPIQNLITDNKEYVLILELKNKKTSIFYYTRILKQSSTDLGACLNFVMNFHNSTFDKTAAASLVNYIEPNSTGNNTSLAHVTINSSLDQVSWGSFKGKQLSTPIPSIEEINNSYTVISLNYVLTSTNANNEMEYYNIKEYYRVRYTSSRMYLLNYDRTMNQIFRGENNSLTANYIQLGIRDNSISYKANKGGTNVCFVQQGELWSYDQQNSRLSQVFSFLGFEGIDNRDNYDQHDIKIINIDEVGNINFAVYGYMNRGMHEGQVGIGIYRYDSTANTVEEETFIPSNQSYQVMKSDIGELIYENNEGILSIMMQGSVYQVDLQTKKSKVLVSGLTKNAYAVSDTNEYFAYVDKDANSSSTIHVLDLNTKNDYTVNAGNGEYVRPLGFMENDFIYGTASSANVLTDAAGNITFPMYKVTIADILKPSHDVLKEYQKSGYFVSDVRIDKNTIYLDRLTFNGSIYTAADLDTIMNSKEDETKEISIHQTNTQDKEIEMQLQLDSQVADTAPKLLTPKEIVLKNNRDISLNLPTNTQKYYVYAQGEVVCATTNLSEAITSANQNMGVVIGNGQKYLWKRARNAGVTPINVTVGESDTSGSAIAKCVSALIENDGVNVSVQELLNTGDTPQNVLKDTLQNVTVLDISGCTADSILYYISEGVPVFALTGSNMAVLVVGYDANNVFIYDPATNSTYAKSMTDATAMFNKAGNVFLTYIKNS